MFRVHYGLFIAVFLWVLAPRVDGFLPEHAVENPDPGHVEWLEEKKEQLRVYEEERPVRLMAHRALLESELSQPPALLVDAEPVSWKNADGTTNESPVASERGSGVFLLIALAALLGGGWFWNSRCKAKVAAEG